MAADAGYRSSAATLRRLAEAPLFFGLEGAPGRRLTPIAPLGLALIDALAAGGDRAKALAACEREAMHIAGLRSLDAFNAAERQAWTRWSPLIVHAIRGLSRWSRAEKRALVAVVRAKGARSEAGYIEIFARHPKLAAA